MSREESQNLADLINQRFDEFEKKWESRWDKMQPVMTAYSEGVSLTKLFFSLIKAIGVIGAAYVVIKMMLHDIRTNF